MIVQPRRPLLAKQWNCRYLVLPSWPPFFLGMGTQQDFLPISETPELRLTELFVIFVVFDCLVLHIAFKRDHASLFSPSCLRSDQPIPLNALRSVKSDSHRAPEPGLPEDSDSLCICSSLAAPSNRLVLSFATSQIRLKFVCLFVSEGFLLLFTCHSGGKWVGGGWVVAAWPRDAAINNM